MPHLIPCHIRKAAALFQKTLGAETLEIGRAHV